METDITGLQAFYADRRNTSLTQMPDAPPSRWLSDDDLGMPLPSEHMASAPPPASRRALSALADRLKALTEEENELLRSSGVADGTIDDFFEARRTERGASPSEESTGRRAVEGSTAAAEDAVRVGRIGAKFPAAAALLDQLLRLGRDSERLLARDDHRGLDT